jgi:hypothetical protein
VSHTSGDPVDHGRIHGGNYNEEMLVVRYVVLAALVVWLGGMIVLGALVAPSTFRVLQAADGESGRMLAAVVFGEALRQFHILAYVCGGVMLIGLFLMKFVGPPPPAFVLRSVIIAAMLSIALYSGLPVSGEIERIRSAVSGPIQRLPDTDPRRLRFDALHRMSTMLMTINIGLGLISLFWYARE